VRLAGTGIELSASDLSNFLGCRHRTALDLAVAHGLRERPSWVDPALLVLQERGRAHERGYASALSSEGLSVVDLGGCVDDEATGRSIEAMRAGAEVILQPALRSGRWFGRPDVFRRVQQVSGLGAWAYEVVDTKLSQETRGGTILQLALYSELLAEAQAARPERFHVVTPDRERPVQTYRLDDFAAYFRQVRARLEATTAIDADALAAAHYPEPVEQCAVCRWWRACDTRRRTDDHLSFVAGISRMQTQELQHAGINTLAQLGALPIPLPFKPRRGAAASYERVREQARLQLAGRQQKLPLHELLPVTLDHGLARLPAPSPGDIFLDLEGDPFARAGGREYLFGTASIDSDGSCVYRGRWAFTDAEERAAFEDVIDTVLAAWSANPGMHVYHYAHYEPAAFKRLMGRHASREAEVDRMLRAEVFVDLYAIVRHSVRASVEGYSIKDLEPFYGFSRGVALVDARRNLRLVERALEVGAADVVSADVRDAVEGYNRDDCVSTLGLREWLERLRADVEVSTGSPVPRPRPTDGAVPEKLDDRARRVQALVNALTEGVSPDPAKRDDEQCARWLLAHLLDWHRREAKSPWWEFFRLRDLADDQLLDEKAAIAGLRLLSRVGGTAKSPIDRYTFPSQETDVRVDDDLHLPDGTDFGRVDAIDLVGCTIDVKKRGALSEVHPEAVFAHSLVDTELLAAALLRLGDDVVKHGVNAGTKWLAARELLLIRPPRLRSGRFEQHEGESALALAIRVAPDLDRTVLAIQGPPGAGKTYAGARMICELVRKGKRVGVTAASHRVIRNLLDAATKAAGEMGFAIQCVHKVNERSNTPSTFIKETTSNEAVIAQVWDRRAEVAAGTPWLWARPEFEGAVDVLFVDEAGQMSLANVLAASQGAKSIVLLGDPQQLEQPHQGSHPEGADRSALEHLLGGRQTVPADRGIFLPETWRLSPEICTFTSEVFYERRLRSHPGLERQVLVGAEPFEGAGLWVVGVDHDGNQNSSREEVDAVDRIVTALLRSGSRWVDGDAVAHAMTPNDVLVVAPYNAHVTLLAERLAPRGIRVGTVDKFQGQEAPVVIYSMATSTPEEAPRGMEFLYSLNRLNVATSRARCACVLVASPRLFEPECKTPHQMRLANALCRYVELARRAELP
jgi:uncharacterized protein